MYVTGKLIHHRIIVLFEMSSANILLDKNRTAKVGDFGLAKTMPNITDGRSYVKVTEYGGSLGYQAPELLEGELGPKLDVYSLGVVSFSQPKDSIADQFKLRVYLCFR